MRVNINSINAQKALRALGANIKTARLKRRISINGLAERIGASKSTVMRLEKGDSGVSIGTLAMACLVLGELDRITNFFDVATDGTGLLLDRTALPKRIDSKRDAKNKKQIKSQPISVTEIDDDEGMGF